MLVYEYQSIIVSKAHWVVPGQREKLNPLRLCSRVFIEQWKPALLRMSEQSAYKFHILKTTLRDWLPLKAHDFHPPFHPIYFIFWTLFLITLEIPESFCLPFCALLIKWDSQPHLVRNKREGLQSIFNCATDIFSHVMKTTLHYCKLLTPSSRIDHFNPPYKQVFNSEQRRKWI